MTWLILAIALCVLAALKVAADQRAYARCLRAERAAFERYTDSYRA